LGSKNLDGRLTLLERQASPAGQRWQDAVARLTPEDKQAMRDRQAPAHKALWRPFNEMCLSGAGHLSDMLSLIHLVGYEGDGAGEEDDEIDDDLQYEQQAAPAGKLPSLADILRQLDKTKVIVDGGQHGTDQAQ
jgi:hypothetical protein